MPMLNENEKRYEAYIFFGYALKKTRDIAWNYQQNGTSVSTFKEVYEIVTAFSDIGNTSSRKDDCSIEDSVLGSDTDEKFDSDDEEIEFEGTESHYDQLFFVRNTNQSQLRNASASSMYESVVQSTVRVSQTPKNQYEDISMYPETSRDIEPLAFSLRNKGGLTRPSPEILPFAFEALQILRNYLDNSVLHRDSLDLAYKDLMGNITLDKIWRRICNESVPGSSIAAIDAAKVLVVQKLCHSRGALFIRQYCTKNGHRESGKQTIREKLKAHHMVKGETKCKTTDRSTG
jgi:hypothetical protein